ncbi:Pex17p Ecym_6459 [Eremothecium cymbalariae DBVPG|uniref:Pex17p n=1 Tax=Eremothecium cymbalariae (strain CBS 270.75 / DBVPG 7215 / KCTC 17166 / NRRL Y-17582) TaxID=931890 RepID=G8JUQ0_ERECY|nr:hypothetical protein Ecym_6459 [Eremothecium cymbalariae DBVPG\
MNQIPWPQQSKIVLRKPPTTVDQLTSLFHNTGFLVSFLYLISSLIVRPLLQKSHKQRLELSYGTLLKLRKLVNRLSQKLKTVPMAVIGFNERTTTIGDKNIKYVDRCSQTSDDEFERSIYNECYEEPSSTNWSQITSRLDQMASKLIAFNYENAESLDNVDSFALETKLLIDGLSNNLDVEHWNKKYEEISENIHELKGWFIRGVVPA